MRIRWGRKNVGEYLKRTRRKSSRAQSDSKFFGRYENIAMLLAGFLVTTVIGGFFGAYLQQRTATREHAVAACERDQSTAMDGFNKISELLGKRLSAVDVLLLRVASGKEPKEEAERYKKAVYDWEEQVMRNTAFISVYFGKHAEREFEQGIGRSLTKVNVGIMATSLADSSEEAKKLGHAVEVDNVVLRDGVYLFDVERLKQIQEQRVGRCIDRSELDNLSEESN